MFSSVNHFETFKPGSVHLTVVLNSNLLWQDLPDSHVTVHSYCSGYTPANTFTGLTWKLSVSKTFCQVTYFTLHCSVWALLWFLNIFLKLINQFIYFIFSTRTRFCPSTWWRGSFKRHVNWCNWQKFNRRTNQKHQNRIKVHQTTSTGNDKRRHRAHQQHAKLQNEYYSTYSRRFWLKIFRCNPLCNY